MKTETKTRKGTQMKHYSIRRMGMTSWADTNSLRRAKKLQEQADRVCQPGHEIVDNQTGQIVRDEE